jgi:hypothetical protein
MFKIAKNGGRKSKNLLELLSGYFFQANPPFTSFSHVIVT